MRKKRYSHWKNANKLSGFKRATAKLKSPIQKTRGAQSALLSGGSTALTLVCRLHATSPTGTFKRCRWRISGTYRTYGTYRTKVDRMANFFLYYLLWCGSRPSIQQMKKSFRLRLIRGVQSTRFSGGSTALTLVCRLRHLSSWNAQTVPQAHF